MELGLPKDLTYSLLQIETRDCSEEFKRYLRDSKTRPTTSRILLGLRLSRIELILCGCEYSLKCVKRRCVWECVSLAINNE